MSKVTDLHGFKLTEQELVDLTDALFYAVVYQRQLVSAGEHVDISIPRIERFKALSERLVKLRKENYEIQT